MYGMDGYQNNYTNRTRSNKQSHLGKGILTYLRIHPTPLSFCFTQTPAQLIPDEFGSSKSWSDASPKWSSDQFEPLI